MQKKLESLSSFDPDIRRQVLSELVEASAEWPAETTRLNMHLHTFFSFNGEGWSPSRIAWEARRQGLYSIAICDFDVLQGLEELLAAADLLQVRAAVGFESRTFFAEYADQEINSPGEPGVFYFMGMGFARRPTAGTPAAGVFDDMLARSHARNRALIGRINATLRDLALDYETDVLPLTPQGNATERHIVRAYHDKALAHAEGKREQTADFWSTKLGLDRETTRQTMTDTNAFTDMLRGKLMKKGGLGYKQPDEHTFPPLDTVITMIRQCRAIPMSTWLDGTSSGEKDPGTQLDCLIGKGVEAVNIIPDRNWNIKDPQQKARKIAELHRYVAAAEARDLPINVGTELNKPGQRFVDDFAADALKPHHEAFLNGARIMVGHTRTMRYADVSYIDRDLGDTCPGRRDRNAFFAAVGALPAPLPKTQEKLTEMENEKAFAYLADSAKNGRWA